MSHSSIKWQTRFDTVMTLHAGQHIFKLPVTEKVFLRSLYLVRCLAVISPLNWKPKEAARH